MIKDFGVRKVKFKCLFHMKLSEMKLNHSSLKLSFFSRTFVWSRDDIAPSILGVDTDVWIIDAPYNWNLL